MSIYPRRVLAFATASILCLWPILGLTQSSLVGSWLVTVEGDAATRTLIVTEEAPTNDGALLAAKYGMSNQRQGSIEAKMLRVGDQRQMVLITQAGTKIAATEQSDGNFQGTFALKSGDVKGVTIVRISDEMRKQLAQTGADRKAEAEKWLAKEKFHLFLAKYGYTYETYPKDGYTYMPGWAAVDPCGRGRIPTTSLVDGDGKLTLEFSFAMPMCVAFKYVFTGTKGKSFTRSASGNWTERDLVIELRD